MKRRWIFIGLILALFCSGCSMISGSDDLDILEAVRAPKNKNFEFTGTWEVVAIEKLASGQRTTMSDDAQKTSADMGMRMYLNTDLISLGNRSAVKPSQTLRMVDAKAYYSEEEYGLIRQDLNMDSSIRVLYISDQSTFSQEFVAMPDGALMMTYDGLMVRFERTSQEIPFEIVEAFRERAQQEQAQDTPGYESVDTALLIGLGIPTVDQFGNDDWDYQTILIRRQGSDQPVQAYKTTKLFVPRSTGFWMVDKERVGLNADLVQDRVWAYPITSKSVDAGYQLQESILREIVFVNPNFIAFEKDNYLFASHTEYEIFELDALKSGAQLGVEKIAGNNGLDAYQIKVRNEFSSMVNPSEMEDLTIDQTNIGLKRENGNWVFTSCIQAETGGKMDYKTFKVDLVPQVDLPVANELITSWSAIRTHSPNAIDALTSKTSGMVIIQEPDELFVYEMYGTDKISSNPLISIRISEKTKIVMAEWAYNDFASEWETAFKRVQDSTIVYYR